MNYLEAWIYIYKVSQLAVVVVVIVDVVVGLGGWFLQETGVVVLEIFVVYKIIEKTWLLLHLFLDYHARGCEAVDSQSVGHLVEADAVQQVVLAVDIKFPLFVVERPTTSAPQRAFSGRWGRDEGGEESRTVRGGLRLYGGVDVQGIHEFHQTIKLSFLCDHISCSSKNVK